MKIGLALAALVSAAAPLVAVPQQPVFRSGVELIAVDVQVVDSGGYPISQLSAPSFRVSINGKSRKVVSAQFVRHADVMPAPKANSAPSAAGVDTGPGAARTVVLAVDVGSFEAGAAAEPLRAAQTFVGQLAPDDLVGLYTFPKESWIAPSNQRAVIRARLSNLVGEKQALQSFYNLSTAEIVDITTESTNPFAFFSGASVNLSPDMAVEFDPVLKVARRECPSGDRDCPALIYGEGMGLATQLERESERSLQGLETLLRLLSTIPGRKAVVLVSGGLLVSDKPEGHPDVGNAARGMGQTAARANATFYTVHVDQTFWSQNGPRKTRPGSSDLARDRAMAGNWLEDFSRSAGGTRINVPPGGTVDFAFDRVLRETSGYYLLGVEPTDADRDGAPRELQVKVDQRGVSVRSRQWVVIPPKKRS